MNRKNDPFRKVKQTGIIKPCSISNFFSILDHLLFAILQHITLVFSFQSKQIFWASKRLKETTQASRAQMQRYN